jgi:hypothetical protein
MQILREAKPPRTHRNPRRWAFYPAALFIGLGLGTLLFYGQILVGTFLVAGSAFLFIWAREGT